MKKGRYISFTTKICLIYAVLLIIPLTLITTISYNDSTDIMREQAIYTNEQSLDQAASYLEYQMSSISSMLSIISYDPTVQILLLQGSQYARGMENRAEARAKRTRQARYSPRLGSSSRESLLFFKGTPPYGRTRRRGTAGARPPGLLPPKGLAPTAPAGPESLSLQSVRLHSMPNIIAEAPPDYKHSRAPFAPPARRFSAPAEE